MYRLLVLLLLRVEESIPLAPVRERRGRHVEQGAWWSPQMPVMIPAESNPLHCPVARPRRVPRTVEHSPRDRHRSRPPRSRHAPLLHVAPRWSASSACMRSVPRAASVIERAASIATPGKRCRHSRTVCLEKEQADGWIGWPDRCRTRNLARSEAAGTSSIDARSPAMTIACRAGSISSRATRRTSGLSEPECHGSVPASMNIRGTLMDSLST